MQKLQTYTNTQRTIRAFRFPFANEPFPDSWPEEFTEIKRIGIVGWSFQSPFGQRTAAYGMWMVLDGEKCYPVSDSEMQTQWELALGEIPNRRSFEDELVCLLNKYSKENDSNTPDHILATYLIDCLLAWNVGVQAREEWYSRSFKPGSISDGQ